MRLHTHILIGLFLLSAPLVMAVEKGSLSFTGSLQHESLFPTVSVEEDRAVPRADWAKIDHLSNSYLDMALRYAYAEENRVGFTGVSAVMRAELTQWPLLGFDDKGFAGHGIGHLHLDLHFRWGTVTVGDVYGQFGSGLILRLYEERSLGIDNALRGGKLVLTPYRGIRIEALGGKQRRYWNMYKDGAWGFNYKQDAVLGANLELGIEQWSARMQEAGANLLLGASWVSKYQQDETIISLDNPAYRYNLPRWVGASDVRVNLQMKGWNALVEYAYKANDPCVYNNYSYRPGHALLASLSYSKKGMSFILQAKHSDNMYFTSERAFRSKAACGYINHLPAFANQHTYALASLYPYATQMLGEWAFQGEVRYTWKRGTAMGGKYGTTLKLNASHVRGTTPEWQMDEEYYTDVNLELNKKLTKDWYLGAMLMYQTYNKRVIEGHGDLVRSGIGVVDVKWATTKTVQMRAELQYLFTRQDEGQWIFALYELSLRLPKSNQLMLSAQEQYCIGYGTSKGADSEQGQHYYSVLATWQHDAHRLSLGYNKTREGFNCSGGVCRHVPAQTGVALTYNYTW